MIYTVTFNPAVDYVITIGQIVQGSVNRTEAEEIFFGGKEIKELSQAESSAIGFVQQSTEHQTVTDKVWHEIAFGMENLNYSQGLMSRRMAEVSAYFGIDGIFV